MSEKNGYAGKKEREYTRGSAAGHEAEDGMEERLPSSLRPERAPKIYTARDVARLLQFDIGTIYRKLKTGELPEPLPLSSSLRWNGLHFDKWVDDGCPPRKSAGKKDGKRDLGEKRKPRRSGVE